MIKITNLYVVVKLGVKSIMDNFVPRGGLTCAYLSILLVTLSRTEGAREGAKRIQQDHQIRIYNTVYLFPHKYLYLHTVSLHQYKVTAKSNPFKVISLFAVYHYNVLS